MKHALNGNAGLVIALTFFLVLLPVWRAIKGPPLQAAPQVSVIEKKQDMDKPVRNLGPFTTIDMMAWK